MERLIVDNFLNLKHIDLDLAKINIIIGREAQGKSVLAKLVYFFKEFIPILPNYVFDLWIAQVDNKSDFISIHLLRLFKKIFPEYSWKNQDFELKYYFNAPQMSIIVRNKANEGNNTLSLDYSEDFLNFIDNLLELNNLGSVNLADYNYFLPTNKLSQNPDFRNLNADMKRKIEDSLIQGKKVVERKNKEIINIVTENKFILYKIVFIPSVRSFFASNIYRNIFYFVSKDIEIDYFSKELGATYEQAKNNYLSVSLEDNKQLLQINNNINQILNGKYLKESEQDWIMHEDNRKVRLSDASSGQQEALPITVILSVLPFLENDRPYYFFIEEPEAHLFPDAQKSMVELFSLVFNLTEQKNGFFITTHSPYILTAFNNLIQAGNARKKIAERGNKPKELKKLYSIVSEDKILDIEDFGVYTLENGEIRSIIDEENRLIDENIIDEISDEIGYIFDKLVDLELGEE